MTQNEKHGVQTDIRYLNAVNFLELYRWLSRKGGRGKPHFQHERAVSPGKISNYPLFCASTRRTPQYVSRSLGFSIFPVGLRGTLAKMIFRGRL